ncbi:MAG TPA: type III-B CRISPR module RAMP protein Cmr4 [Methanothrix sp.]|nr:type III-B CRISPR module RAMP protein Cmr4 [Methanothrix sp.]
MKSMILGLLAETPVHSGAGRSEGFIDLPVAREAVTNYPVIAASSIKGSLKDLAKDKDIFGDEYRAGDFLISDARLLLLPVRSLTSQYKWATCPHIIERLGRDLKLCGLTPKFDNLPLTIEKGGVLGTGSGKLFLEEREFNLDGKVPKELREEIGNLIVHQQTRARLEDQLIVMHNDDFQWFASYGLPVNARNKLDSNKKSENLWYEESLAPDTLLYSMLFERKENALDDIKGMFNNSNNSRPYLQLGGNETVGMGWFAVSILGGVDGPKQP